MHVAALRPARTQNAHGGGAAARSGGELEPDLLPALLPHAGRPSESGSLPHAGAARILQNRSARTAGAACRRIAAFRSVGTAGALSARHLHAQPRPQFRISGGQIRHRTDAGRSLAAGRHTPGQPPRTAAGASRGILRSGRIRHGARHGLPHGRGDPAALLRRSLGLLADAPYSGNRRRRQAQASGDFQGQHHRHQPRLGAAIRLRQLHRTRSPARQRPDAARTPARGGQPLHARLARRGADAPQRLRVAGPVAAGDGILRRQTVRGVPRRTAHPEHSENRKQLPLPPCKNKHH